VAIYREYRLRPPLNRFVECVWCLSQTARVEAEEAVQPVPPDGTVEVIFHLGEPFTQVGDGLSERQPATMVVGVWTQPIGLVAPPGFDTVGIRIKPGAASALWADSMDRFTDAVVDATAVWGRAATDVRDRLAETASHSRRLEIIAAFLETRLRQHEPALAGLVDRIAAAHGCLAIDALAAESGTSPRQLERAFRAHVGVSPKMFSRIVRFQNVLRCSARIQPGAAGDAAGRSWADVACECGYADQSHLIRDFRQFAGETPTSLCESTATVADYFRRR